MAKRDAAKEYAVKLEANEKKLKEVRYGAVGYGTVCVVQTRNNTAFVYRTYRLSAILATVADHVLLFFSTLLLNGVLFL